MKRTSFLVAGGLICGAVLWAQTQPYAAAYQQMVTAFQQADSLAAGRGGRGPIPRAETGKPFSATATTQTIQAFPDGMHVSQTTTMVQYRDAEGRVRTETSEPGVSASGSVKTITIRDPVAGVSYNLDPAQKTAVRIVMAGNSIGPESPSTAGARGGRGGGRGDPSVAIQQLQEVLRLPQLAETTKNNQNSIVEDLGAVTINGVPARGTRLTTTVPVGAIGNDKEFRSITERWFSPELNLLIKSVSSDPRFGTTTYELTNISRQSPDPSLFQAPPDYNIVSTQPTLPTSKVIESIEIRGVRGISADTLKATVLSKVGDFYDEGALRRDFTALWKTNLFSDVQMKTEPGGRGGIIIHFVVTQRP